MPPARRPRRAKAQRGFLKLVAMAGIIGIGVLLGAILVGQDVAGWIVGLVVGAVCVVLTALVAFSRQL